MSDPPPFVAAFRERQNRRRGADVFLEEEMADYCYVRVMDMMRRWEARGGNHKQLLAAIERGPYIARREDFDEGRLWIYHADSREEDAYDRMVAACIHRWRASRP
jgi:hypothetical protein